MTLAVNSYLSVPWHPNCHDARTDKNLHTQSR